MILAMTAQVLRQGRLDTGLKQTRAARLLGVSQPYLAMLEKGRRRLTPQLVRRAMRVYGLSPAVLPHSSLPPQPHVGPETLARDLGSLGYPGFSYARSQRPKPKNPGDVLLTALAQPDLEARLVEALPWLLLMYVDVDHPWLVQEAKARILQNRLGFVVSLARSLSERGNDPSTVQALRDLEQELEHSRLAREDTLCKSSVSEPERRWLEQHRPEVARHWKLLTDWKPETLRYAAAAV
jgi:transcriptional regulator with XRE-family HTH domain